MSRGLSHHDTAAVRGPSTTPSTLRCLLVWAALTSALGSLTWLCVGALVDTATVPAGEGVAAEQSVVLVACVAGAWASLHVWVVASLAVLDSLRGRALAAPVTDLATDPAVRPVALGGPGLVRRLTLVACGVAVTAGAALPAYAAEQPPGATTSELAVLDGLPYPERASTPARETTPDKVVVHHDVAAAPSTRPVPRSTQAASTDGSPKTVTARTVRPGDSLWAIASELTGSRDASVVSRRVHDLHHANRTVIGDDPDLIHPGQQLRVHPPEPLPRTRRSGTSESSTDQSSTDQSSTTDRSQEGSR